MTEKPKVLAVVGPTASGKTALGAALAKAYGGEVISADSMQIYEGLDIASAKPMEEEMLGVPHHLIGVIPRDHRFSVAEYAALAHAKIAELTARGHLPVMVGGTGLYVDTVLGGMDFPEEEQNSGMRETLTQRLAEEGKEALHAQLAALDPEAAAAIHPNNAVRVIRALEVCLTTGMTFTAYKQKNAALPSPYDALYIGLDWEREVLYERIDRRVTQMAQNGLLEEVQAAMQQETATAGAAIGYKELFPYFAEEKPLDECLDDIRRETRRYAKRQLTWFRRNAQIHWLKMCESDEVLKILEKAQKIIAKNDFL